MVVSLCLLHGNQMSLRFFYGLTMLAEASKISIVRKDMTAVVCASRPLVWIFLIYWISLGKSNKSNKSKPREEIEGLSDISSRGMDLLDLLDFPREIQ